jgi:hypothetical protein
MFIAPATRLGMSKPQVLKAAVIIFLIAQLLKFLFLLFINYMISLCGFSAWGLGLWFYVMFILFGPWPTFMAPLYSAFLLHPPSRWRLFLHAAVIAQAVASAVLIFPPPSFYPSFSPPDAPRLLSIDDYIFNYGLLFFVVFFIFSTGASVALGLRAAEVDGVSRRLYQGLAVGWLAVAVPYLKYVARLGMELAAAKMDDVARPMPRHVTSIALNKHVVVTA